MAKSNHSLSNSMHKATHHHFVGMRTPARLRFLGPRDKCLRGDDRPIAQTDKDIQEMTALLTAIFRSPSTSIFKDSDSTLLRLLKVLDDSEGKWRGPFFFLHYCEQSLLVEDASKLWLAVQQNKLSCCIYLSCTIRR